MDQKDKTNRCFLEDYSNLKNVGEIMNASGIGKSGNNTCGGMLKLFLQIDKSEIVQDCKFQVFGRRLVVISGNILINLIKGKSVKEVQMITEEVIEEKLEGYIIPEKKECVQLVKEAIDAAIQDYKKKSKIWEK